jgi:hypothetical protein
VFNSCPGLGDSRKPDLGMQLVSAPSNLGVVSSVGHHVIKYDSSRKVYRGFQPITIPTDVIFASLCSHYMLSSV